MSMFTVEELKLIAKMLDSTPIQGTLLTLPEALHEILIIRKKLQIMIENQNPNQEVLVSDDSKSPN